VTTGEVIASALLAVNVIGLGGLVVWLRRQINAMQGTIGALKGTVDAQKEALGAVGKINDTVLSVFTAMDPERWAKEVKTHKELADLKVERLLEEQRRSSEASEKDLRARNQRLRIDVGALVLQQTLLIPYVPKDQRIKILRTTKLDEDVRKILIEYAEEIPEIRPTAAGLAALWSWDAADAAALRSLAAQTAVAPSKVPPPDAVAPSKVPPPEH
jgi:hypothetical protein